MGECFTLGSFNKYFPIIKILLDYLKDAIRGIIYKEDKDKKIYVNTTINKISIGSNSLDIKVNKSKDKDITFYLTLVVITTKELGKYYKYRPLRKLYNIGVAIH